MTGLNFKSVFLHFEMRCLNISIFPLSVVKVVAKNILTLKWEKTLVFEKAFFHKVILSNMMEVFLIL
jgi:hypothetical protein